MRPSGVVVVLVACLLAAAASAYYIDSVEEVELYQTVINHINVNQDVIVSMTNLDGELVLTQANLTFMFNGTRTIAGTLELRNCYGALTNLSFLEDIETVTDFTLRNCDVPTLSGSESVAVERMFGLVNDTIRTNLTGVPTDIGGIYLENSAVQNLGGFTAGFLPWGVTFINNQQLNDLSVLATLASYSDHITIEYCPAVTTIDMSNVELSTSVSIVGNAGLLNVKRLVFNGEVGDLVIADNPSLTTLEQINYSNNRYQPAVISIRNCPLLAGNVVIAALEISYDEAIIAFIDVPNANIKLSNTDFNLCPAVLVVRNTGMVSFSGLDGRPCEIEGGLVLADNPHLKGFTPLGYVTGVTAGFGPESARAAVEEGWLLPSDLSGVTVTNNSELTSLMGLGGLTHVYGKFEISHNPLATSADLSQLNYIETQDNAYTGSFSSLPFEYSGDLVVSHNDALAELLVPELWIVSGNIEIQHNPSLASAVVNTLNVTGSVTFTNNSLIDCNDLSDWQAVFVGGTRNVVGPCVDPTSSSTSSSSSTTTTTTTSSTTESITSSRMLATETDDGLGRIESTAGAGSTLNDTTLLGVAGGSMFIIAILVIVILVLCARSRNSGTSAEVLAHATELRVLRRLEKDGRFGAKDDSSDPSEVISTRLAWGDDDVQNFNTPYTEVNELMEVGEENA